MVLLVMALLLVGMDPVTIAQVVQGMVLVLMEAGVVPVVVITDHQEA